MSKSVTKSMSGKQDSMNQPMHQYLRWMMSQYDVVNPTESKTISKSVS